MQPSCFLLKPSEKGTVLYLGEVSTEDCLELFDRATRVTLVEFGAASGARGWVSHGDLPIIGNVGDLISILRERSELSLVDLSATVGHVALSTHDDGEAQLVFPNEEDALSFLRVTLPDGSEAVISRLLENPGKYIAWRGTVLQVFDTFDDYLVDGHETGG